MKTWIRDNGLSIALLLMFFASLIGQVFAGWTQENETLAEHDQALLTLWGFLTSGEFLSALFENWESEFLQMSAYVILTAMLIQRGSAESRDPDDPPRDENLATQAHKPGAPRILEGGDVARWVYAHSLGLALFTLFLLSFGLHWSSSAKAAAAEALQHGDEAPGKLAYLGDPQLWFESFQNWQSEFLSTAVLVVLSIWLRQRESPESKPVAAPHSSTGAA